MGNQMARGHHKWSRDHDVTWPRKIKLVIPIRIKSI